MKTEGEEEAAKELAKEYDFSFPGTMNSMKTFALVEPSLKERRNLCSHIVYYSVCLYDCLVDVLWTVTRIRNHG